MPQLDITILFPQIFWLLFFFTFFYVTLTYFFLPKFLVSLKLRRNASENNLITVNKSLVDLNTGTELSKSKLHQNLACLTKNFESIKLIYQTNTVFKTTVLDTKLSTLVQNLLVFSDKVVLKNIKFSVKGFRSN